MSALWVVMNVSPCIYASTMCQRKYLSDKWESDKKNSWFWRAVLGDEPVPMLFRLTEEERAQL